MYNLEEKKGFYFFCVKMVVLDFICGSIILSIDLSSNLEFISTKAQTRILRNHEGFISYDSSVRARKCYQ